VRKSIIAVAVGLVGLIASPNLARAADHPDLSTPKKAATAFATGLQNGSMSEVKAAAIGSDQDMKLIESLAGFVHATKAVTDAGVARFGAEGGKNVLGNENTDMLKDIEQSEEKIEGDAATLAKKGQSAEQGFKLKKSSDGWKVDLTKMPEKQQLAQALPVLKSMQKVMNDAAADIKAGKYKTAAEAKQGIQAQMVAAFASQAKSAPGAAPEPEPAPQKPDAPSK